jgi:hypothetical protein
MRCEGFWREQRQALTSSCNYRKSTMETKLPVPPFTPETAAQKVRMAGLGCLCKLTQHVRQRLKSERQLLTQS